MVIYSKHLGVSKNSGTPKWMENPIKMDDLGVPPFSETAICKIYLPKHAVATLYMMGQGTPSCLEFRFLKDVVLEFGFFVGGSKIDFNRVR